MGRRGLTNTAEKPHGLHHHPMGDELYTKIPVDDLVVYAVKRVLESGEECTFERLVCEAFTLFPKQFALQRYPQWPDSARVNKSWLRCRTDKGWIAGSVQEGFRLTPKGERAVEVVAKRLSLSRLSRSKRASRPRERYEAVLRSIRQSEAFRRFIAERTALTLSEIELRSILGGTLETPPRILRQNLQYYLDVAQQYQDAEVADFLAACKDALEDVLRHQRK